MSRLWKSLCFVACLSGLFPSGLLLRPGPLVQAEAAIIVTSPADAGSGTLRWALEHASPGDTVAFDPGSFPPQMPVPIRVLSALPALSAGNVTLTGLGAGVILDGSLAPEGTPGLVLSSDGNVVQGLTLRGFRGPGIRIQSAGNRLLDNLICGNQGEGVLLEGAGAVGNLLLRNAIGVTPGGTPAGNGGHGVRLTGGAHDNLIGLTRADANVLGANAGDGVHLEGTTTRDNLVQGNFLGTDRAGRAGLGNGGCGVQVQGGTRTRVGGVGLGEGNVVAGNALGGICLEAGARGHEVVGNLVGTPVSGLTALPNQGPGILLEGGANTNTVQGNLTSGNLGPGALLRGAGTDANLILGNRVGVNAVGAAALPNGEAGILVEGGAAYNLIGRVAEGEANQVSGNAGPGVWLRGAGTQGNVVAGNLVGTDFGGFQALGNEGDGIRLSDGARENLILANLVAANGGDGVRLAGEGTTGNWVAANSVGWDNAAAHPLPNEGHGVHILDGAAGNRVGELVGALAALGATRAGIRSLDLEWGNRIAHNRGDGVRIAGAGSEGNALRRNRITGNGGQGIRLVDGANGGLPAPVIQEATSGRVTGLACAACWVELFADPADEGGTFLGAIQAEEDRQFLYMGPLQGPYVTATATDAAGNTSPFSPPKALGGRVMLPLGLANR
ncbi:MAG: right-handed parallel beta-helix repeat-containing protein [Anaerolineae bacterium]